jgi:hypothetical protein
LGNGRGAAFASAHAAAFEAVVDQRFAGGLDHAGADQPAVGQIRRVVGAMLVASQVAEQLAMSFADFGRAVRQVQGFQVAHERGSAGVFEAMAPTRGLRGGGLWIERDLSELMHMFGRVEEVRDPYRLASQARQRVFDQAVLQARSAIGQRDHQVGPFDSHLLTFHSQFAADLFQGHQARHVPRLPQSAVPFLIRR